MKKTGRFPHRHDPLYYLIPTTVLALLLAGAARLTPGSVPPAPGELIINEILYAPPGTQTEFIELYNRAERTLDLGSIRIADSRRQPVSLTDDRLHVDPGQFAVIAQDLHVFHEHFPDVAAQSVTSWPQLNNSGDAVLLYAGNMLVDSVRYTPGWGGESVSLERVSPAAASNRAQSWQSSTAGTRSTPGRHNSVYAPDRTPPQVVFAEQISSRTVLFHADEALAPSSARSARYSCGPDTRSVEADLRTDPRQIEVTFAAPPSGADCSIDHLEDRAGNRTGRTRIPLAYRPTPGDLVISEIMYQPLADPYDSLPDQPEYLEIYNRTARNLNVRHLYRTDQPDEDGIADTTVVGRPLQAVPAGGYGVIFADPDEAGGTLLRRSFPELTLPLCLLPVRARSLGLRNDGETIRLHAYDGTVIDQLEYSPDWHHVDLVNPQGIALERISADGPSNDGSNWSSSTAPPGGTPGHPNSLSPPAPENGAIHGLRIHPSPFSPDGDGRADHTLIEYVIPHTIASLRVRIFGMNGYLVRTLAEVYLGASSGTMVWDGRDDHARHLPPGVYVVLLEVIDAAGGTVAHHKAPVVIAR